MKSKPKSKKKNQLSNEPHIEFITDRRVRLVKKFEVKWFLNHDRYIITVPKGFVTDGCSIPKILWGFPFFFVPFEGKTFPCSVVHDYFYRLQCVDKRFADDSFFSLLKQYNVHPAKRFVYWLAVSLFGKYK